MKKLNLAIMATTLMLSFSCQKEIESTPSTNQEASEVQTKLTCTPPTTTYKFLYTGAPQSWNYGSVSTPSTVTPNTIEPACYANVFVTPDYQLFQELWDIIYNGSQLDLRDHLGYNYNTFVNYFGVCMMDKLMNGIYTPTMYNYQSLINDQVEYVQIANEYGDILWIYEFYYA